LPDVVRLILGEPDAVKSMPVVKLPDVVRLIVDEPVMLGDDPVSVS
jgi:hypothetical protein